MLSWIYRYQHQLIIVVLTLIVFIPALDNEFVLDDHAQLLENTLIHDIRHIPRLFIGSTFYGGRNTALEGLYYRPIMLTAFSLIYHFFGPSPAPYHALQILLHTTNALLLYFLLSRWLTKKQSLVASLLFAIHPINVEAVVYISNLQDVGFTFFGLISTLLIIERSDLSIRSGLHKSQKLSLLFVFLALLFKEVAIIFVIANCAHLYITRKNWEVYTKYALIVSFTYAILRLNAVGAPTFDRVIPIADASFIERLHTFPKIHWYYLKTFFAPIELAIGQNWVVRQFSVVSVLAPLTAVFIAYAALAFRVTKHASNKKLMPLAIYASSLLVIGLLIHSQFFPLDVTVANRWFYVPSIGLIILLTLITSRLTSKKVWSGVSAVIILLLTVLSIKRVNDWHTGYSLYSTDYPKVEDSFTLENNLGLELLKRGEVDQAIYHLERSTSLSPRWGISWNNLGGAYETKHTLTNQEEYIEKAIKAYQKAIEHPSGHSSFINLARLYTDTNHNHIKTQGFIKNSLKIFPESPELWFLLSKSYAASDATPSAIQAAKTFETLTKSPIAREWLTTLTNSLP